MENTVISRLAEVIEYLKAAEVIKNNVDIAYDLGIIREGTISDILRGRKGCSKNFLQSFCSYYGINIEYMKEGSGPIVHPDTPLKNSKTAIELTRSINAVSVNLQIKLNQLAYSISSEEKAKVRTQTKREASVPGTEASKSIA